MKMTLVVSHLADGGTGLSLVAETQAEESQLRELRTRAKEMRASAHCWNNCYGEHGITLHVRPERATPTP